MKRFAIFSVIGLFALNTALAQPLYPVALGTVACADKVSVTISESKKTKGHYDIQLGKVHYDAVRVVTDSGAIRLEDKKHGVVWLQMSNKSMLLNEKMGKRLANDCRNDMQIAKEKELIATDAPNILDSLTRKDPTAVVTP